MEIVRKGKHLLCSALTIMCQQIYDHMHPTYPYTVVLFSSHIILNYIKYFFITCYELFQRNLTAISSLSQSYQETYDKRRLKDIITTTNSLFHQVFNESQ